MGVNAPSPGSVDEFAHRSYGLGEAREDRSRDDAVPDVQLLDLGNRGDGGDVLVGEAVPGMHREAERPRELGGVGERPQRSPVAAEGVGIRTRVQLDGRHVEIASPLDGVARGIDEQADANAGLPEAGDRRAQPASGPGETQSALGGHLLPSLRHERGLMRRDVDGDGDDVRRCGQLEVEYGPCNLGEELHVAILHVTAVLAQVERDAVGAGELAQGGGPDGVRLVGASRLTDGGDVIDVDVEPHGFLPCDAFGGRRRAPEAHLTRLLAGLIIVAALAGCGGRSAAPAAPSDPTTTLSEFLDAVKGNDLAAMARLFGTVDGPAAATTDDSEALRKTLVVIQRYLAHDSYRVVGPTDPSPTGRGTRLAFTVEITRPTRCVVSLPIELVRARDGNWLVLNVNLDQAGNPARPCPER